MIILICGSTAIVPAIIAYSDEFVKSQPDQILICYKINSNKGSIPDLLNLLPCTTQTGEKFPWYCPDCPIPIQTAFNGPRVVFNPQGCMSA